MNELHYIRLGIKKGQNCVCAILLMEMTYIYVSLVFDKDRVRGWFANESDSDVLMVIQHNLCYIRTPWQRPSVVKQRRLGCGKNRSGFGD